MAASLATSAPLSSARLRLAGAFDRLFTPARLRSIQGLVVQAALAGFAVHLLLVFLARQLASPPAAVAAVGTNYLAALYTPFSFVLFYEVLLLIVSIPESITRSIGKQYEIFSLIVIRNVFKDIAEFESVTELSAQIDEFVAVLLDMSGGLLMFLFVAAFYHANRRRPRIEVTDPESRRRIEVFIARKKVISLLLSGLLVGLAVVSLASWSADALRVVRDGAAPTVDVRTIFYLDLFTVMILADALILILSLPLSARYELVFRNAAFIASTVLLRFSLAVQKPYDVELGLVAMAFGTAVLLVYGYYLRVEAMPEAGGAQRGPEGTAPGDAPAT